MSCVSQGSGQLLNDDACDAKHRPQTEQICPDNPKCFYEIPQSSHVEHKVDESAASHWSKGDWEPVSLYCFYIQCNHIIT